MRTIKPTPKGALYNALIRYNAFATDMFVGAHVPTLLEDDGFVVVEENSVFNVPANGAGTGPSFQGRALFPPGLPENRDERYAQCSVR
jgi:hypothetical protein